MKQNVLPATAAFLIGHSPAFAESFLKYWATADTEDRAYSYSPNSSDFLHYGFVVESGVVFYREPTDRSFRCVYHSWDSRDLRSLVNTIGVNFGGMDGCPKITSFETDVSGMTASVTFENGASANVVLGLSSEVEVAGRAQIGDLREERIGISLGTSRSEAIELLSISDKPFKETEGQWLEVDLGEGSVASVSFDDEGKTQAITTVVKLNDVNRAPILDRFKEERTEFGETTGVVWKFQNASGEFVGNAPDVTRGCNANPYLGTGYGLFDYTFPGELMNTPHEKLSCLGGVRQTYLYDEETRSRIPVGSEDKADYAVFRLYDASFRYRRFMQGATAIGNQSFEEAAMSAAD